MINTKSIALFLFFSLTGCTSKLSIEDGIAAYEKKDFFESSKIFMDHQDNPVAMYYLAMLSLYGNGMPKNSEAAVNWLKKSAELDNPKSLLMLGCLYLESRPEKTNIKTNNEHAVELLLKAAKLGEKRAYAYLGDYYNSPKFEGKMIDLAVIYYTLAGDDAFARFPLINIYEKNNNADMAYNNLEKIIQSKQEGIEVFKDVARLRLAEYYYYGYERKPDFNLAVKIVAPSVKTNPLAKSFYAWLLFRGDGITPNASRAVSLWNESINSENGTIQTLPYIGLAIAYEGGIGVRQDIEKAKEYFDKGAWNIDGGGYWYAKMASSGFLGSACPSVDSFKMWTMEPKLTGDNRYNSIAKEAYLAAYKCLINKTHKTSHEKNINKERANLLIKRAEGITIKYKFPTKTENFTP